MDPEQYPELSEVVVSVAVEAKLEEELEALPTRLKLTNHFLCGISQIAIGADTAFTRVCQRLRVPQRIFLPQTRDLYFSAKGERVPDFSDEQRAQAEALLEAPHVAQVRVVSSAATREQRFEEVNLEIVRVSDVMIVVTREGNGKLPGGTEHALGRARSHQMPILKILVSVVDGKPQTETSWENEGKFKTPKLPRGDWPQLPKSSEPPSFDVYSSELLNWGSRLADWQRQLFAAAALVVIATHLAATICAASALALHGAHGSWHLPVLLLTEVTLLMAGFAVHQYLHRSKASQQWALARSVAEVARSLRAAGGVHAYLDHLFSLPYPAVLRPLLRTLSLLHSAASRPEAALDWRAKRDAYLEQRVRHQLKYFRQMSGEANKHLHIAHGLFIACTLLALLATCAKLYLLSSHGGGAETAQALTQLLGTLAIVLPALAVGAVSFAASLDREARAHTFAEMADFLEERSDDLTGASSALELERMVLATECRLLGENANWSARRSFTAVS